MKTGNSPLKISSSRYGSIVVTNHALLRLFERTGFRRGSEGVDSAVRALARLIEKGKEAVNIRRGRFYRLCVVRIKLPGIAGNEEARVFLRFYPQRRVAKVMTVMHRE